MWLLGQFCLLQWTYIHMHVHSVRCCNLSTHRLCSVSWVSCFSSSQCVIYDHRGGRGISLTARTNGPVIRQSVQYSDTHTVSPHWQLCDLSDRNLSNVEEIGACSYLNHIITMTTLYIQQVWNSLQNQVFCSSIYFLLSVFVFYILYSIPILYYF